MKNFAFWICVFFMIGLLVHTSCAAVGETYDQMVQKHGTPEHVSFEKIEGNGKATRYEKADAKVYIFHLDKFKIYAEFNSSNACFKMVSLDNRTLPPLSLLVGKLANTTPKVLSAIPLRAITLQYGEGENAVIYHSWGVPGNGSVEAISRALEPK